jgi:hypothetical protein
MPGVVSPKDLRKISEQMEMEQAKKLLEKKRQADADQQALKEMFMVREVHPEVDARVSERVRQAAERGEHEVMLFSFPSEFCTDGGRAINNFDPAWPETLTGFARKAFEYFESNVKPQGYKLRMQIINYPGGVPGDVGVFLSW